MWSGRTAFGPLLRSSEVEAIAELAVDFARGVVVKSAKGKAVVEQDAAVCNVESSDAELIVTAELLACGEIDGSVLRQVVARILGGLHTIGKS